MKLIVCTIYDKVANEGGPLFLAKNMEVAQRLLAQTVKDTHNPEDYELRFLGYYYPEAVVIESMKEIGSLEVEKERDSSEHEKPSYDEHVIRNRTMIQKVADAFLKVGKKNE